MTALHCPTALLMTTFIAVIPAHRLYAQGEAGRSDRIRLALAVEKAQGCELGLDGFLQTFRSNYIRNVSKTDLMSLADATRLVDRSIMPLARQLGDSLQQIRARWLAQTLTAEELQTNEAFYLSPFGKRFAQCNLLAGPDPTAVHDALRNATLQADKVVDAVATSTRHPERGARNER